MPIQRYSINQHPIETLLTWIKSGEIAIPEIQRPFVWNAAKVRDFMDSLYNGYPVGYLIAWRNPDVRYSEANHVADKYEIDDRMERLRGIKNNSLGVIELNADLTVETVAEIFVRINSQAVTLNAADFAMSKMAASEQYGGHLLRKCIDYFCHLAVAPEAYGELAKDGDFASTDFFRAMEWLKNEKDDLYDPSYTDMLRVTLSTQFKRGRLEDLVALLSGRNFETRTFEVTVQSPCGSLSMSILKKYLCEFSGSSVSSGLVVCCRFSPDTGDPHEQTPSDSDFRQRLAAHPDGGASAGGQFVGTGWAT